MTRRCIFIGVDRFWVSVVALAACQGRQAPSEKDLWFKNGEFNAEFAQAEGLGTGAFYASFC
jgi:hypothetical protein